MNVDNTNLNKIKQSHYDFKSKTAVGIKPSEQEVYILDISMDNDGLKNELKQINNNLIHFENLKSLYKEVDKNTKILENCDKSDIIFQLRNITMIYVEIDKLKQNIPSYFETHKNNLKDLLNNLTMEKQPFPKNTLNLIKEAIYNDLKNFIEKYTNLINIGKLTIEGKIEDYHLKRDLRKGESNIYVEDLKRGEMKNIKGELTSVHKTDFLNIDKSLLN